MIVGPVKIGWNVWRVAGVAALGPLISNLDSTVVNVSLNAIGRDLHVGLGALQWVVSGYLLALALTLPLSGWLVDRFGTKRLYLACFTLFTIASLLCGISSSAPMLIAARVLQGMVGGLLAPMAQMMVAREAPNAIARVMGVMVIPVLLGPIFGPSLAGLILEHASWHWIFFINLPIGVLAIALAAFVLPTDGAAAKTQRSFDLLGFLLIASGLALLLYSLERVASMGGVRSCLELLLAIALLSGFGFVAIRRKRDALIDLGLFRSRSFSASAATQFLANATTFGGQVLVPLYLLGTLSMSPGQVGLLLGFTGLGALCSYPSMGAITDRFGCRWVSATGAIVGLLGTLPFAVLPADRLPLWMIAVALFVRGLGLGGLTVPSIAAAYSAIARKDIPVATTAINIVQRLGGPIATTLLTLALHLLSGRLRTGVALFANVDAGRDTFWFLCAFHGLSLLTALYLPLRTKAAQAGSQDDTAFHQAFAE